MQAVENREAIILENQGEKIFAVLHRPLGNQPVPAIVICPGFAGTKCGKFRLFVTLGKELAKRGIAVLRFDYRGAGDSEGEFSDMTVESKVSDTLTCLHFLAQDPQIEASHLGLLGRSLGGAIAVLAARRYASIKSLALWAPVFKSDPWRQLWEAFNSNQAETNTQDLLRHLPPHIPNLEFLQQFFKLDMAQELKALRDIPLLHIQGEQDQVVKIEHAQEYRRIREGIDQTHFIQLPRSDHDFSDPLEQLTIIEKTVKWYQTTLMGSLV
jgi:alpha/beta superfamily hydrolase